MGERLEFVLVSDKEFDGLRGEARKASQWAARVHSGAPRLGGREWLCRVSAPHFTAGLIVANGRCIEAAPILKWAVGKSAAAVGAYIKRKGWRYSWLPAGPHAPEGEG